MEPDVGPGIGRVDLHIETEELVVDPVPGRELAQQRNARAFPFMKDPMERVEQRRGDHEGHDGLENEGEDVQNHGYLHSARNRRGKGAKRRERLVIGALALAEWGKAIEHILLVRH